MIPSGSPTAVGSDIGDERPADCYLEERARIGGSPARLPKAGDGRSPDHIGCPRRRPPRTPSWKRTRSKFPDCPGRAENPFLAVIANEQIAIAWMERDTCRLLAEGLEAGAVIECAIGSHIEEVVGPEERRLIDLRIGHDQSPPGLQVSPAGSALGFDHLVVSMICTTAGSSGGDTAAATAASSNVALATVLLPPSGSGDEERSRAAQLNKFGLRRDEELRRGRLVIPRSASSRAA